MINVINVSETDMSESSEWGTKVYRRTWDFLIEVFANCPVNNTRVLLNAQTPGQSLHSMLYNQSPSTLLALWEASPVLPCISVADRHSHAKKNLRFENAAA